MMAITQLRFTTAEIKIGKFEVQFHKQNNYKCAMELMIHNNYGFLLPIVETKMQGEKILL